MNNGSGSLLLPDGWYGRPYDNQHTLTSIVESGGALTVVLDSKVTLCFRGLKSVRKAKYDLVIGPFEYLRFDWESFGPGDERGTKEYRSGEIESRGCSGISNYREFRE